MIVLSVEGPAYVDKGAWTTHKVLGVFETREAALATVTPDRFDDEDIVVLTDTATGKAERVGIKL